MLMDMKPLTGGIYQWQCISVASVVQDRAGCYLPFQLDDSPRLAVISAGLSCR